MTMIRFQDVRKNFGKTKALSSLSFNLHKGCITALIGPNGAGKTTALRILKRLLSYEGNIYYQEKDLRDYSEVEYLRKVFFVSENKELDRSVKLKTLVDEHQIICPDFDKGNFFGYLEKMKLFRKLDDKIGTLSLGMRTAVYLLLGIAGKAEILILDEPLSGLDPIVRHYMIELLKEIVINDERTVLYSSHVLEEVEEVSDRLVILHEGRSLYEGTMDDAKDQYAEILLTDNLKDLNDVPGVLMVKRSQNQTRAFINKKRYAGGLVGKEYPLNLKEIFIYLIESNT